ncbi:hypothetical protein N7468_009851 [Penicillium chermesinum]|uniref:Secreted protein n=1 Tax=Penicillium chermesinum TaxID=63820 RepID=A0A9W9TBP8_9EURO|nr:uncharacterized protein N7468_009851 [Penicillium chermesinum]KAJ5216843.1 hypothetical protein N7468_009851 [Penicillium chermesinum]
MRRVILFTPSGLGICLGFGDGALGCCWPETYLDVALRGRRDRQNRVHRIVRPYSRLLWGGRAFVPPVGQSQEPRVPHRGGGTSLSRYDAGVRPPRSDAMTRQVRGTTLQQGSLGIPPAIQELQAGIVLALIYEAGMDRRPDPSGKGP